MTAQCRDQPTMRSRLNTLSHCQYPRPVVHMAMPRVAPALLAVCLIATVVVLFVVIRVNALRRRDARLFESWGWALEAQTRADVRIAHVVNSYQRARRGTKAVLEWPNGTRQDAWVEGAWFGTGCYLVVRHSFSAYGPHNRNPNVCYTGHPMMVLPHDAPRAWQRHKNRLERQSN